MSEAEIDKQLDARFRKAADDRHDVRSISSIRNDNRNQLTTPVILGFLVLMGMFSIGLAVVAIYAGSAATSAEHSERNAKLAQYQLKLALDRAHIEVPDDLTEK